MRNGCNLYIPRSCILIVDDCPEQGEGLGEFLGRRGFEVRTTTNAFAALSILKRCIVSIALVDINMPNFDGLELYKTAHLLGCKSRFILMSGHQSEVARANLARFQDLVIDKPINPYRLSDYLVSCESRSRAHTTAC